MTRSAPVLAVGWLVSTLAVGGGAAASEADRPEIVEVTVLGPQAVGRDGAARLTYRALRANVVAVVRAVEDLDGVRRATRQQEFSVVAAAFGREAGDLTVPLAFDTPGRKRLVFMLLTDEREESEPTSVELEVFR